MPTKMNVIPLFIAIASLLCINRAQAQTSANTSGGNATGSGGNSTYSVGQVVYTTATGSTGSVAQGVQHAYQISPVGLVDAKLKISLTAYPNPATDHVTLYVGDYTNQKLKYELVDAQGKTLSSELLVLQQTQIRLSHLPIATYFLRVTNHESKIIQSFKIIKTY
jgi:hypothetical protein